MIVLPQKYDELELSKYDKQLLALFRSVFKTDDTTFLLCCNPTKTINGIGHVLICPQGVLLIHMKTDINEPGKFMSTVFPSMAACLEEEEILASRFAHQRNLVKNGNILFPFKVISFFTNLENPNIDMFGGIEPLTSFIQNKCIFHDFWKKVQKDKSYIKTILGGNKEKIIIREEITPDIINRVAPEYTIPQAKAAVHHIVPQKGNTPLGDRDITSEDRASVAYMLDESQINYINKIKKGDQLIIACAGSGKSILLISKCFKVAGLNPDKHFLITGYNRNLVSYFKWLIDSAGFSTNNVECLTFDKLCIKLLQDNGIRIPSYIGGDYSKVRDCFIQHLNNGVIRNRYYGIFIDEVQMFEPEWYKACYQLVENKNSDEHFFVICGDKSQSIKNSIKSGKAPWQGHGDFYPNFRGKSFPIEINYRNTIQINDYIRRFTDKALQYAESLNIPINQDADIFLRGKSVREGINVQYVEVNQAYLDSDAEALTVINQIVDIHDHYHIPYDSIAVICYNRQYKFIKNRMEKHYEPIEYLKKYLQIMNIPYSLLNSTSNEFGVSYANIEGVPIVTMESSLGLDFQAVIICGLLPLGLHDKTKDINVLKLNNPSEKTTDAFNRNINILYMACSRAKDILRIVSAETTEQSIYVKLLKEALPQED